MTHEPASLAASVARLGPVARPSLVVLVAGMSAFLMVMGVFVSQNNELVCTAQPVTCERVETYPFGVEIRTALGSFEHASTRVKQGRRGGTSLDVVLHHADGTETEFSGVGKSGARAVETVEVLNAFIAASPSNRAPIAVQLRSGSIAMSIILLLLGLGALVFLPSAFSRVTFKSLGEQVQIRIGRWPIPATEHVVPCAALGPLEVRLVGTGRQMRYQLFVLVENAEAVDLRIASAAESGVRKKLSEVEAILAPLRHA